MTAIADLPDIRPSLLLDFANSGRVDPRIECTRASSATCFGPDGKLRTVPANTPRIDYDPATGKCLGLLVEEARTNYLKYSADFSQNVWAKIRSSIALNSAGVKAPDGSIAYKLVEDSSTSNTHNIGQHLRLEPNTEYTFSAFIKAAERQYAFMSVGNFVTQENPQALRINLVTGSVLGGAEGRYKITKLQDGWFIVSSMFKTAATISVDSSPNIFTAIDQTPTGSTYSGDGVSGSYVGGVQLEVGTFPTSYIPTEGTAVTRAAENISVALPSYTTATIFAAGASQADYAESSSNANARRTWFRLYNDYSLDEISVFVGPVSVNAVRRLDTGGASAASIAPVASSTGGYVATALSYSSEKSLLKGAANGVIGGESAYVQYFPYTHLSIGSNKGARQINGHIRRIATYETQLAANQLQRLTA